MPLGFSRLHPLREDAQVVLAMALRECRVALPHPARGAAVLLDQHRRHWRGRLVRVADDDIDRVVAQLAQEGGFPIVLVAVRHGRVEQRLHHRERHRLDRVDERSAERPQRSQEPLAFREVAAVTGRDRGDRLAIGRVHQRRIGREFVRRRLCKRPVELQQIRGAIPRMDDQPSQHHRDRMQPVFERGDDAEVAAATAQGPEQIGMLVGADAQHLSLGGHQFEGHDIVAGEAVFPCEPADTAAERQACNAGLRDHARRHRQTENVRLAIQFAEQHARLDAGAACCGIDVNALHAGQVDDDAAVAQGAAAHVVTTAAYRDEQSVFAREAHRGDDVRQSRASGDEPRTLVDAGVPDPPRGLVLGVAVPDHCARKAARNGSSVVAVKGFSPASVNERVGMCLPPGSAVRRSILLRLRSAKDPASRRTSWKSLRPALYLQGSPRLCHVNTRCTVLSVLPGCRVH